VPVDDPFLSAVAELAAAARRLGEPAADDAVDPLTRIRDAVEVRRLADEALAAAVDAARAAGRTWQQVGDVLGTSRQAAFQRFGHPVDPRTGRTMDKTTLAGADGKALDVFAALVAGQWDRVHAQFDATMAEQLPVAKLADTWAVVVGTVGAHDRSGEPFVRRQGDYTVVDVPLAFEAGDMVGRVAFDQAGRVAGLFVLDPAQAAGGSP
jgi:hypothetical protein